LVAFAGVTGFSIVAGPGTGAPSIALAASAGGAPGPAEGGAVADLSEGAAGGFAVTGALESMVTAGLRVS
jgi:hypothetical protein